LKRNKVPEESGLINNGVRSKRGGLKALKYSSSSSEGSSGDEGMGDKERKGQATAATSIRPTT
jgi:hypothetical protein